VNHHSPNPRGNDVADELLIDDGYTVTRTIDPAPGLHPQLTIMYRQALDRERNVYRSKLQSADPSVLDSFVTDLILKYVVSINGTEYKDRDKITRMKPTIRSYAVDLVLGYSAADEAADAGKSRGA